MKASLALPVSKPSRQGEAQLRSDLVSTQVQLWFKQLRRIQSYKHAAIADKQTLDAEVYRLNLWTAIKNGRGFDGFFNVWWLRRRRRLPSPPFTLPLAPRDGHMAEQIFLDFKLNFEAFEQWHCRQHRKLLQLKYDQSCHRLFHDLRPPRRDQLDLLWHTMDFTILAIDDSTRQLHLDQPVEVLTGCVWFVNNMQVEVETADGDVLGLHELPPVRTWRFASVPSMLFRS